MEPDLLPEFVHDLADWTRRSAPTLWAAKSATGSPFYWPPGVTNPVEEARDADGQLFELALSATSEPRLAQDAKFSMHRSLTIDGFRELAAYHATTLEQAKLMYVGRDITYLAGRTQMKEFRLDLDLFYLDPKNRSSLMTCGFIMWETPIGEAEPRGEVTSQYDALSGELLEVEVIDELMAGFNKSESPVNALTWRILPGAEEVLIVFYADGPTARRGYERHVAAQKGNLPPGMGMDKDAVMLQASDPQPLEREQVLPLNKTLDWFDIRDETDGQRERLRLTIGSDLTHLPAAERRLLELDAADDKANKKVLPMVSQMVKTFVATMAIRRMKLTQQEEIPPPKQSVKRMRRGGASTERQESRVQVIRIGRPLKRKAETGEPGKGGKWKVKTVIGPVIRTRQYVPAYDEYRDGVWMIEPYIAGPADAPWSKNAKVFLLE